MASRFIVYHLSGLVDVAARHGGRVTLTLCPPPGDEPRTSSSVRDWRPDKTTVEARHLRGWAGVGA